MTRATYSLTGIEGPLFYDKDGQLTFEEKGGINYAPTTVQVSLCSDSLPSPHGEPSPMIICVDDSTARIHLTIAAQLPGGERVPFFFTIKRLEAKATSPSGLVPGTEFGGSFTVPSYRSGLFLDPKVWPGRFYLE